MYLIDTNICVYAINGRHPNLNRFTPPSRIFISAVTVGELEYGAAKSHWGKRTRELMYAFLASFTIISFTQKDATIFGEIRAKLAADGKPIGAYDVMIAAQGIARNLTVVTHNIKEFSRVPCLDIEDWL